MSDIIMVETCEMCEDWWPAGSLIEIYRVGEPNPSKICIDCLDDLRRKERRLADRANKVIKKKVGKK